MYVHFDVHLYIWNEQKNKRIVVKEQKWELKYGLNICDIMLIPFWND
jgi:hypothetical protein